MDQWKRRDSPEKDPHRDSSLIFSQDAKAVQWRKDSLFSKQH